MTARLSLTRFASFMGLSLLAGMRLLACGGTTELVPLAEAGTVKPTPEGGPDGTNSTRDATLDAVVDVTTPSPVDGGCGDVGPDDGFQVSSCCNGSTCRGVCQHDDGGMTCDCFGIVGGCPESQLCCPWAHGCNAPVICYNPGK